MENNNSLIPLRDAVEAIKTAIMQGQYEALKEVNRVQLAVYYAIGKYLSKNTRKLAYGSGALKAISDQLRREMPGLRGFSATQLNEMRRFYEAWKCLDSEQNIVATSPEDLSVMTDESQKQDVSVATDKLPTINSSVATDEFVATVHVFAHFR